MSAPWFSVATHFKGTTEVHGSVDNPKIVEMFRVSGHPEVQDDETPWCAAFVGACLRLSGYRNSGSLGARSYQKFGQDLKQQPRRGCVVVLWREDPKSSKGHVAFYDREDDDHIFILGGNQQDQVTTARYPKSRVVAYRWPTETAPLPTNTTLPNILTIDPANAPAHLAGIGTSAPAVEASLPWEPWTTGGLSEGSQGPDVLALQSALSGRNFQVGPLDGEFGPLTRAAVAAFQTVQGLPVTGDADGATLRALGLVAPGPVAVVPAPERPEIRVSEPASGGGSTAMQLQPMQPQTVQSEAILKTLLDALIARQAASVPVPAPAPDTAGTINSSQLLQVVLASPAGRGVAAPPAEPSPASPSETAAMPAAPVLSPIDNLLGGQALAGKKTALAVLAYVVLAIFEALGISGTATGPTATPTGEILTTLIAAFGGLGGIAKIDRAVQTLGLIATRPPAAPK
jgi:uncharacterized protein (TIGR02594 family)